MKYIENFPSDTKLEICKSIIISIMTVFIDLDLESMVWKSEFEKDYFRLLTVSSWLYLVQEDLKLKRLEIRIAISQYGSRKVSTWNSKDMPLCILWKAQMRRFTETHYCLRRNLITKMILYMNSFVSHCTFKINELSGHLRRFVRKKT